ncbi:hypothetical protein [Paludibacterium purpuratum]|uniref:Uncharacterized protein n=1 Tax=Paludibacterium purpuratum TaxID=1144873 RepID=A0A4V3DV83_9NEIS|nr:hypothetical protein [Paludibacterium purpuratum]TDR79979.1 hypothetical protein DFP86_106119 [Paludibacterium purpuratum]
MCAGIEYAGVRLYFKDTPTLPILRRDGGVDWVQWGVPYGRDMPGLWAGACARRESLLAGKWHRLQPRPVKIPCSAYMERDPHKQAVWFPVPARHAIQGALVRVDPEMLSVARSDHRAIVYVVTEPAEGEVALIHDRMPRLISLDD